MVQSNTMEPNKNIPSFCFESPWLKPFNLDLNSVEVTAGERRIHATWTPEMAQDLQTYHNIDAEAELTRLLTEEINREIISKLKIDNYTLNDKDVVEIVIAVGGG